MIRPLLTLLATALVMLSACTQEDPATHTPASVNYNEMGIEIQNSDVPSGQVWDAVSGGKGAFDITTPSGVVNVRG